jgi:hypothetical protein
MSTQNQINLKDKSITELKALAFDLKNLIENYTQMFQVIMQEVQGRVQAEQAAAPAPEEGTPVAPPKKASKLKKA